MFPRNTSLQISAVVLSQRILGYRPLTSVNGSATITPGACISFNIVQYYFESAFVLKWFGPIDVRCFTTSNCMLFALDLFYSCFFRSSFAGTRSVESYLVPLSLCLARRGAVFKLRYENLYLGTA